MTEGPDSVTTRALSLALDAAALRQRAFTLNIANAGSAGHVPLEVDFETRLTAARNSLERSGSIRPVELDGVRPQLQAALGLNGQSAPLELDAEASRLAQNALHFQALLRGLNRHLSILSTAAADGRR